MLSAQPFTGLSEIRSLDIGDDTVPSETKYRCNHEPGWVTATVTAYENVQDAYHVDVKQRVEDKCADKQKCPLKADLAFLLGSDASSEYTHGRLVVKAACVSANVDNRGVVLMAVNGNAKPSANADQVHASFTINNKPVTKNGWGEFQSTGLRDGKDGAGWGYSMLARVPAGRIEVACGSSYA